jgi:hypothetical protein
MKSAIAAVPALTQGSAARESLEITAPAVADPIEAPRYMVELFRVCFGVQF